MKRYSIYVIPALLGVLLLCQTARAGEGKESWRTLAKGVEYGLFPIDPLGTDAGKIHVLRLDPAQAALKLVLASQQDGKSRTAAGWCRDFHLLAAVNAGMYQQDYLTNAGYLRNGRYVQNRHWNRFKSALAFGARKAGIPQAVIVDLDRPEAMNIVKDYHAVVQNLRLIKGDGVNVWEKSDKRWSEAAVGMDREKRILFFFCHLPLTMWEFNETVKSLGLGVVSLMHMEGGPLASLSVRTRGLTLDLAGGYETAVRPDEESHEQWPIPNVIGVQAR